MVGLIMNLISKTQYSCERMDYTFMVLREYTIISHAYIYIYIWIVFLSWVFIKVVILWVIFFFFEKFIKCFPLWQVFVLIFRFYFPIFRFWCILMWLLLGCEWVWLNDFSNLSNMWKLYCGGAKTWSFCVGLKAPFTNNNAFEEEKTLGKAL